MKKNLTLLTGFVLFFCSSYAQAPKTILYEQSTCANCVNCPYANVAVDPILLANYKKIVALKYQTAQPGGDVMYYQDPSEVDQREGFYDFLGSPQAVLQGDTNILSNLQYFNGYPGDVTDSMINAIYAQTTQITMRASYAYDTAADSIHTTIIIKNVSSSAFTSSGANRLRLMVALQEMDIHFSTAPGSNGEQDFYYVFRKFYPDTSGTIMPNSLAAGDSLIYTFAIQPPSYIYNKNEMAIAAWVQDFGTSAVHQAVRAAGFNGLADIQLADSSVYPSPGPACNKSFTPRLRFSNFGTEAVTSATIGYSYGAGSPVTDLWAGSLDSGQSTIITFPTAIIPGNTFDSILYFADNINGGTIVGMDGANSFPVSPFQVSVNAIATIDTLSETFEGSESGFIVDYTTPIAVPGTQWSGFVATDSSMPNFWFSPYGNFGVLSSAGFTNDSIPAGGYGQSSASFCFPLCLYYELYEYYNLDVSSGSLIFDPVDRTGYVSGNMTFQHAYCYNALYLTQDTLKVLVSTNCGQTWDTAWMRAGADLGTTHYVVAGASVFTPGDSDWHTDTVDMSAYNGQNDVVVQFQVARTLEPGATALYLDNINWVGVNPTAGIKKINTASATVYPNPAASVLNIQTAGYPQDCAIEIYDMTGQRVIHEALTGSTTSVSVASLAEGVYLYRLLDQNGHADSNGKVTKVDQ